MRLIKDLTVEEKKELIDEILNKDITGKEWSDIAQMFNLDMAIDNLRKAGVGIRMFADTLDTSESDTGYIERQKIRDLTRKVNAMYRQESRSELLREIVEEAVKNVEPLPHRSYQYILNDKNSELVLCIGDSHFGADIDCRGLMGETINKYNEEVFIARLNKLYNEVITICKKEKINVVRIFMVGDLIDGILRQSQLQRLEYGLVEQVIRFSEYMSGFINDLSRYVYVYVSGVSGNHSEIRPLNSKAREFEEENLEKIIFWYLNSRFISNDRVSVDIDCDRMKLEDVLGYRFLLLHGDGEKKIEDIARSSVNLYGNKIDFFVCGHLHKISEYHAGATPDGNSEIIRVPSMCGMDLYAQNKGYGGMAGAIALVIEEGYGCRCKYPIKL